MSKVTVILPIHEFNETVQKYLDASINSVLNQVDSKPNLLIVYTHRAEEGGIVEYLKPTLAVHDRITTIKNKLFFLNMWPLLLTTLLEVPNTLT